MFHGVALRGERPPNPMNIDTSNLALRIEVSVQPVVMGGRCETISNPASVKIYHVDA
jgi:hypothetical protein